MPKVLPRPMVVGELALGALRNRRAVVDRLADLVTTPTATHQEVLDFVENQALHRVGLSLVDAHLLAALRLAPPTRLWTRDRRLGDAADRLGMSTG